MDWDSIADKLKESFDEDTVKSLIDALKQAAASGQPGAAGGQKTPEEIAEALGRVLGKFGAGAAGGATGLDPELLKFLLELFGPLAKDLLGALMERFLGGEDYDLKIHEGNKRSRIWRPKEWTDFKETYAPDVHVIDNLRPTCEGDSIVFTIKLVVVDQEEPIDFVKVQSMGPCGSQAYPRISFAGTPSSSIPEPKKQEVGGRYEIEFKIDVPCAEIFRNSGSIIFVVIVQDTHRNQVVDFCSGQAADFILKEKCCKTEVDDAFRTHLLEIIRTGMRPLNPADLENLIERIVHPKTEARPAPSTPAPPSETAPKAPAPKAPGKKTGAGVRLGDLLVEVPIVDLEAFGAFGAFEEDLEIEPPPERRGGQTTRRPR